MRMPSSLASAAATSACAASSTVSPSTTKSVAPCSVSGISCATWPIFQAGGIENSPLSSCSLPLRRPKKDDLPAPLRPTRPIFSPGVKVTDARSSTTLTPRRSVTLRTEIIRSYFGEDWHDSRPEAQGCLFSGPLALCGAHRPQSKAGPGALGVPAAGPANVAVNGGSSRP
ncbi:exported hypothetical protein [Paraburkholderia unamae]|nr:exported hypothetical protein [Paraburkholderia unamae]